MKRKILVRTFFFSLILLLISGFLFPQHFVMSVKGAGTSSYNKRSFWYYPWGKSITHKGVDIFAKEGIEVISATSGWVLYAGELKMGGKVVVALGPQWRIHYYAHLQNIYTKTSSILASGEPIGTVGTTGNAKGKPPHLHYSIVSLIPYPWRADSAIQGWMKMFYLNPIEYMEGVK